MTMMNEFKDLDFVMISKKERKEKKKGLQTKKEKARKKQIHILRKNKTTCERK